MSSVKAKLVVMLKADEVVVAEVDDAILWQRVLLAINSDKTLPLGDPLTPAPLGNDVTPALVAPPSNDAIGKLARELEVDRASVEGALSPTVDTPYMHLNSHNWEAMRKQLPPRGITSLSPIGAAATVLSLWFRAAGLGNPTQAQALTVLKGLGQDDKNPSRGVRAATWLIARPGGQIQLNAAEISTAVKLGKAFCSKQWTDWTK